jgi:hypothetical protein
VESYSVGRRCLGGSLTCVVLQFPGWCAIVSAQPTLRALSPPSCSPPCLHASHPASLCVDVVAAAHPPVPASILREVVDELILDCIQELSARQAETDSFAVDLIVGAVAFARGAHTRSMEVGTGQLGGREGGLRGGLAHPGRHQPGHPSSPGWAGVAQQPWHHCVRPIAARALLSLCDVQSARAEHFFWCSIVRGCARVAVLVGLPFSTLLPAGGTNSRLPLTAVHTPHIQPGPAHLAQ